MMQDIDSVRPLDYWFVKRVSSKLFEVNEGAGILNALILATDGDGLSSYFILRVKAAYKDFDYYLRRIPKEAVKMILKEYGLEMVPVGSVFYVSELAELINNDFLEEVTKDA